MGLAVVVDVVVLWAEERPARLGDTLCNLYRKSHFSLVLFPHRAKEAKHRI